MAFGCLRFVDLQPVADLSATLDPSATLFWVENFSQVATSMPFHAAPVSVPSCDVPDVVAGLDAVRVAIIHAGQVGTFEIFHPACKGARRTRSALAAELDVGIKFPTVFTEPARREGGNPFTMLSAIADASFLCTLAGRPGALVRRLEGRAVVVTVVLPAFPIYHVVDRRADPEGEGKGKGKGKGKGGGKGSGRGRGKGGAGPAR
jgi:hypothetical protein